MPVQTAQARLIDSISSLKRAAHLGNLKHLPDRWKKEGECVIFTDDESVKVLHNLLVTAFSAGHTDSYWRDHPEQAIHEKIDSWADHETGLCQIKFPASENTCQMLAEKIESLTKTLIAPDRKPRTR